MGLLKYIKKKKENRITKKKIESFAGKEITPDCITMLCFADTEEKNGHGYIDKNRSFDYIIPVIRAGKKYFNIMTLEEVFFDEKGNITNESIAKLSQVYPKIPFTKVKYVGKEDATITFEKPSQDTFGYGDFLVTIKDSKGFETKMRLFRKIHFSFKTVSLYALREVFENVQYRLSRKTKENIYENSDEVRYKKAKEFLKSLESEDTSTL